MFEVLIPLWVMSLGFVCARMCISPCWPLHGVVGRHLQCSHWSDQIDVCRPHRSCCRFPPSARPPVPSPQGGHTDRSPVTGVCYASRCVLRLLMDKCLQHIMACFAERVSCTRMYWNSSTGESGPEATALRPSNRECFLVMRRSLFLMAATILSSEPWCVLIEYRWQPGQRWRNTDKKTLRVVPQRCPNKGCTHPLQRPKHLVWDRFSHISWSVKIHLKERRSLKGASFKQKFFSGLQVIIFFVGCVNLKIQCEGSGSYTLVKDNIQVLSLLWQRNTSKIDPSADNHHLFPVRLRWVAKTHPGEVPLFSVWIICVDIRALLYLQHHSLTHASRRNSK